MKIIVIISVFLYSVLTIANQEKIRIRQIDLINNKVALSDNRNVVVDDVYIATFPDSRQCSLLVLEVRTGVAIADISTCEFASHLQVGQILKKSIVSANVNRPEIPASDAVIRKKSSANWYKVRKRLKGFSAFGYYNFAEDVDVRSAGQSGTVIGEKALGLGAEYKFKYAGYEIVTGGGYEKSRQFSRLKSQGQTTNYTTKPELNLWAYYANLLFELMPGMEMNGGFNFSFPTLKNAGKEEFSGNFGYQFGVSYMIIEDIFVDAIYRKLNFKGKGGDIEDGALTGLLFRGRYVF